MSMNLPFEVNPPARRYAERQPIGDKLRRLLIDLGAHAKVAATTDPPVARPQFSEFVSPDVTESKWDRGHHTLYRDDPRTINEIVSQPIDSQDTDLILHLIGELNRALITVQHAASEKNAERLHESLVNARSLVGAIAHLAETTGSSPVVSDQIQNAETFLRKYELAA